jgi:hypothetical protein
MQAVWASFSFHLKDVRNQPAQWWLDWKAEAVQHFPKHSAGFVLQRRIAHHKSPGI